jgi:hypothetical protein
MVKCSDGENQIMAMVRKLKIELTFSLRQTYGRAGEKPKSISRITAAQIDAY